MFWAAAISAAAGYASNRSQRETQIAQNEQQRQWQREDREQERQWDLEDEERRINRRNEGFNQWSSYGQGNPLWQNSQGLGGFNSGLISPPKTPYSNKNYGSNPFGQWNH